LRALKRFDEADAVLEEGQVRMADPHAMYLDYPRAAEAARQLGRGAPPLALGL